MKTYYKGEYVERFGKNVAKPKISQNITDDEVAGVVTIFTDLLIDYALRRPFGRINNVLPQKTRAAKTLPTPATT
jgi:hypothetical protein